MTPSSSSHWFRMAKGLKIVTYAFFSYAQADSSLIASSTRRHAMEIWANSQKIVSLPSQYDLQKKVQPQVHSFVSTITTIHTDNSKDHTNVNTNENENRNTSTSTNAGVNTFLPVQEKDNIISQPVESTIHLGKRPNDEETEKENQSHTITPSILSSSSSTSSSSPATTTSLLTTTTTTTTTNPSDVNPLLLDTTPTLAIQPKETMDVASPRNDTESSSFSSSSFPSSSSSSSYKLIPEGRPVPSTQIGRALGFASLGMGLLAGTAMEYVTQGITQRTHNDSQSNDSHSHSHSNVSRSTFKQNVWRNDSNANRLAKTLCRMRGASLKLGQMLSLQDQSLLPSPLAHALQQVRQNAEAMPLHQLHSLLQSEWKEHYHPSEHKHVGLQEMDTLPFAAASIGQVHMGRLNSDYSNQYQKNISLGMNHPSNSRKSSNLPVVIKVQYPGVAESIESDLSNLQFLITMTGLAPSGLFLENILRVGREELQVECDYIREKNNQLRLQQLVEQDPDMIRNQIRVPTVIQEMSTERILTSEYCPGMSIDKAAIYCHQEERNRISRALLQLTMKELFEWRFMQTDPNWSNFIYDIPTKTTYLIDFGAAREYSKSFVDGYLRIVWAAANQDETTLMEQSIRMGFLTGQENSLMTEAHKLSGYTVGEPFATQDAYDFAHSGITQRLSGYGSTFLQHRLTPPPEEIYTLHRKLAGTYNLCIKLGAKIHCRDLLLQVVQNHVFEDGLDHPLL